MEGMLVAPPPTPSKQQPLPGARMALLLLLSINLFNYLDRQVLAAVEPKIHKELQLTNSQSGFLSFAFLITYMIAAPIFGWLGDRMGRWRLIAIGVAIWSLASAASGLDWHVSLPAAFVILLITRCFVGIGEGAYGPVAPTIIADLYPVRIRGRVMAWFFLAIPVGGALGYALGGQVAASSLGWRWAFYLVLPPGLLLALWCLWMCDPPRGQADAGTLSLGHPAGMQDYLHLLRIPSYVLDTLGMASMTFAIGGLAWWMPAFLEDRQVAPVWGIDATTIFGGLTALAGLIATFAGGIIGDKLRNRYSGSYFIVSGIAMLFGFPAMLGVVWMPFPIAWIFVFLAVFFLFFNTGPTNTILANVTHPSVRASAFAFNIFTIHILGDAISPLLMGYIIDRASINAAFLAVSLTMLTGGIIWLFGARFLQRDTELAPVRMQRTAGEVSRSSA